MKLNETRLIITQLPPALIHSDSEVDYHVATGITGMSVVGPMLLYTNCHEGNVWCCTSLEDASEDGVS